MIDRKGRKLGVIAFRKSNDEVVYPRLIGGDDFHTVKPETKRRLVGGMSPVF